jgi:hypothetical protein
MVSCKVYVIARLPLGCWILLNGYQINLVNTTFAVHLFYIYKSKRKFAKYEKKHTKILLVDDEPDILEIVGYNLTQEGYQILQRPMERSGC